MKSDTNPSPKKTYHPPKLKKLTLEMAQLLVQGEAGQEDEATDSLLEFAVLGLRKNLRRPIAMVSQLVSKLQLVFQKKHHVCLMTGEAPESLARFN